jgi:hypothetical protein
VCDNGSTDGSVTRIERWASGAEPWTAPPDSPLGAAARGAWPKPLALLRGADKGDAVDSRRVRLLEAGTNRGFAGGVNLALRQLAGRTDWDYVWLLNNDTVVDPHALDHLVARIGPPEELAMCGSTLVHYDAPGSVQARAGATYRRFTGRGRLIDREAPVRDLPPDCARVEAALAYISAASMLVTRGFLERVGPMCEDYFLYFEELDWTRRAGPDVRLLYAPHSLVYHKEGASIGTAGRGRPPSPLSEYYFHRNRLRFTSRHHPVALPAVYLTMCGQALLRLVRGEHERFSLLLRVLAGRRLAPAGKTSG